MELPSAANDKTVIFKMWYWIVLGLTITQNHRAFFLPLYSVTAQKVFFQ